MARLFQSWGLKYCVKKVYDRSAAILIVLKSTGSSILQLQSTKLTLASSHSCFGQTMTVRMEMTTINCLNEGLPEEPTDRSSYTFEHTADDTCIQPAAHPSQAIWCNVDYVELVNVLESGIHPSLPLPYRTIIPGHTALHATKDPTMKLSVNNAITKFNLPDLYCALANFVTHFSNNLNDPLFIVVLR
ncbi:hypothetical protein BYT27DRAFT_7264900 [Phlegmacium glaucopus]|nr:hypothetical protein BYT27DRAFT_7264900 [Phlegmacium glaucopus]